MMQAKYYEMMSVIAVLEENATFNQMHENNALLPLCSILVRIYIDRHF